MTEMTQEQREYFIDRLEVEARAKIKAKAVELFGPTGRPEQPTWGVVFAAIKAGEITLKEGTEDSTRAYLNPSDVEWPAMDAKKDALEDYRIEIEHEKERAIDSIMLNKEALDILTAFTAL